MITAIPIVPGVPMQGRISEFGGIHDDEDRPDEGLALYEPSQLDLAPLGLFMATQPPGTTGLFHRLNPEFFYCAMNWDYKITPKALLRHSVVYLQTLDKKRLVKAVPVDQGPALRLLRLVDVSRATMAALGVRTDDEVIATLYPIGEEPLSK